MRYLLLILFLLNSCDFFQLDEDKLRCYRDSDCANHLNCDLSKNICFSKCTTSDQCKEGYRCDPVSYSCVKQCQNVDCGGQGICEVVNQVEQCNCNDGYQDHDHNLICTEICPDPKEIPEHTICDDSGDILIWSCEAGYQDHDQDLAHTCLENCNTACDLSSQSCDDHSGEAFCDFQNYIIKADSGGIYTHTIKQDALNNRYIMGTFSGSADLNPLSGTDLKTTSDYGLYITKLSPNHRYLWSRIITSSEPLIPGGLAVDSSGNSYITGTFQDQLTINEKQTLKTSLHNQLFLIKINADGSIPESQIHLLKSENGSIYGEDIGTDSSDGIYLTGWYKYDAYPRKDLDCTTTACAPLAYTFPADTPANVEIDCFSSEIDCSTLEIDCSRDDINCFNIRINCNETENCTSFRNPYCIPCSIPSQCSDCYNFPVGYFEEAIDCKNPYIDCSTLIIHHNTLKLNLNFTGSPENSSFRHSTSIDNSGAFLIKFDQNLQFQWDYQFSRYRIGTYPQGVVNDPENNPVIHLKNQVITQSNNNSGYFMFSNPQRIRLRIKNDLINVNMRFSPKKLEPELFDREIEQIKNIQYFWFKENRVINGFLLLKSPRPQAEVEFQNINMMAQVTPEGSGNFSYHIATGSNEGLFYIETSVGAIAYIIGTFSGEDININGMAHVWDVDDHLIRLSAAGSTDIFISAIDIFSASMLFTHHFKSEKDGFIRLNQFFIDEENHAYLLGDYRGSVDFSDVTTSTGLNSSTDGFLLKLDLNFTERCHPEGGDPEDHPTKCVIPHNFISLKELKGEDDLSLTDFITDENSLFTLGHFKKINRSDFTTISAPISSSGDSDTILMKSDLE